VYKNQHNTPPGREKPVLRTSFGVTNGGNLFNLLNTLVFFWERTHNPTPRTQHME
jgi:hypothetical protein